MEITKNKMQVSVCEVPQWEAQVLLGLWGDDARVVDTVEEERELPDPSTEFERLANKYGPKDEDVPVVAKVYGSFGIGNNALAREIQASIIGDEADVAVQADDRRDQITEAQEEAEKAQRAAEATEATQQVGGIPVDEPVAEPIVEEVTIGADDVIEVDVNDLLAPGTSLEDLTGDVDEGEAE
jgi:hypothetical protein